MKRFTLAVLTLLLAIFAAAVPTTAATIMIDDFVDADNMPDHSQQGYAIPFFTPANPFVAEHTQEFGTILGGERDLQIQLLSPLSFFFDAVGRIGDVDRDGPGTEGEFDFGSASSARVRAILEYDGNDPGEEATNALTNALGLGNMNLIAGGNDRLVLTFRAVDPAPNRTTMDLRIEITGPAGTSTWDGLVPQSATEFDFAVPYSAFSIPGTFGAVSSLRFIFNGTAMPDQAVDFNLKSIQAVPEPTSLGLASMAVAGMGFVAWRKRHK